MFYSLHIILNNLLPAVRYGREGQPDSQNNCKGFTVYCRVQVRLAYFNVPAGGDEIPAGNTVSNSESIANTDSKAVDGAIAVDIRFGSFVTQVDRQVF